LHAGGHSDHEDDLSSSLFGFDVSVSVAGKCASLEAECAIDLGETRHTASQSNKKDSLK
jgi:hypothetical protein